MMKRRANFPARLVYVGLALLPYGVTGHLAVSNLVGARTYGSDPSRSSEQVTRPTRSVPTERVGTLRNRATKMSHGGASSPGCIVHGAGASRQSWPWRMAGRIASLRVSSCTCSSTSQRRETSHQANATKPTNAPTIQITNAAVFTVSPRAAPPSRCSRLGRRATGPAWGSRSPADRSASSPDSMGGSPSWVFRGTPASRRPYG